jgi:hypothetical protein
VWKIKVSSTLGKAINIFKIKQILVLYVCMLKYFISIWCIFQTFGIFVVIGHIVWSFGIFLPIWRCCTKKNLAAQVLPDRKVMFSPRKMCCCRPVYFNWSLSHISCHNNSNRYVRTHAEVNNNCKHWHVNVDNEQTGRVFFCWKNIAFHFWCSEFVIETRNFNKHQVCMPVIPHGVLF